MTAPAKRKPGRPRTIDADKRLGVKLPVPVWRRFEAKRKGAGLSISEAARKAISEWADAEA